MWYLAIPIIKNFLHWYEVHKWKNRLRKPDFFLGWASYEISIATASRLKGTMAPCDEFHSRILLGESWHASCESTFFLGRCLGIGATLQWFYLSKNILMLLLFHVNMPLLVWTSFLTLSIVPNCSRQNTLSGSGFKNRGREVLDSLGCVGFSWWSQCFSSLQTGGIFNFFPLQNMVKG